MFWVYILVLFIISFLWAFFSLKRELSRPKEIKKAKKDLLREKILFKK